MIFYTLMLFDFFDLFKYNIIDFVLSILFFIWFIIFIIIPHSLKKKYLYKWNCYNSKEQCTKEVYDKSKLIISVIMSVVLFLLLVLLIMDLTLQLIGIKLLFVNEIFYCVMILYYLVFGILDFLDFNQKYSFNSWYNNDIISNSSTTNTNSIV